jgi:hypothetical protein
MQAPCHCIQILIIIDNRFGWEGGGEVAERPTYEPAVDFNNLDVPTNTCPPTLYPPLPQKINRAVWRT